MWVGLDGEVTEGALEVFIEIHVSRVAPEHQVAEDVGHGGFLIAGMLLVVFGDGRLNVGAGLSDLRVSALALWHGLKLLFFSAARIVRTAQL
jgi:hypothetical protein